MDQEETYTQSQDATVNLAAVSGTYRNSEQKEHVRGGEKETGQKAGASFRQAGTGARPYRLRKREERSFRLQQQHGGTSRWRANQRAERQLERRGAQARRPRPRGPAAHRSSPRGTSSPGNRGRESRVQRQEDRTRITRSATPLTPAEECGGPGDGGHGTASKAPPGAGEAQQAGRQTASAGKGGTCSSFPLG